METEPDQQNQFLFTSVAEPEQLERCAERWVKAELQKRAPNPHIQQKINLQLYRSDRYAVRISTKTLHIVRCLRKTSKSSYVYWTLHHLDS